MGPILGLPDLGSSPTVTGQGTATGSTINGNPVNNPALPILGTPNPGSGLPDLGTILGSSGPLGTPGGMDDPLDPANILLGPLTPSPIAYPSPDELFSSLPPVDISGGSSTPPRPSLPSGFFAGPTQWNQMNDVMQAVNNAVTHESNTWMSLYHVSLGNFVGFGQILAGNTPTTGYPVMSTHSQTVQSYPETQSVINGHGPDGHTVTWQDILQVSDNSMNNTWGNCAEQAASACVMAQEMLGGQYPNMMTSIGYLGGGHAVALIDFDGDTFADGFIDPYYGKYGSFQTLALQEGKPMIHQSPWFKSDGTSVSSTHPPIAMPFAGVAP